jgi:DNA-binding response OmpR family regulator
MPTVLAIVRSTPRALEGRSLLSPALSVERYASPAMSLLDAPNLLYDLLVLAEYPVEEQQSIVAAFQENRRWRVVPVLYVVDALSNGFVVPGNYRPEMDGIVRGQFGDSTVESRMRLMAREGVSQSELVVAGPFELDATRGRLATVDAEVVLTDRETEIFSVLLERMNRAVLASEIIERSWGAHSDERHLQILRRHVSNLRRKLDGVFVEAVDIQTIRGLGYRLEVSGAGTLSA